ncbi:hypothetical protein [Bacillus thuringiensis]|uniref:hypothetical protein n=1 Tax=Bacillus thuringiensis TaxID=1428 RepID=UPI001427EBD1|nr:hypothetical protein [Bacillus thuringiensis]NIL34978.1 hypothetical protein [Bacillus thuringiensis]
MNGTVIVSDTESEKGSIVPECADEEQNLKWKLYKVGDISANGDYIKVIISQSYDFVVYLGKGNGLGWGIRDIYKGKNKEIIRECIRLKGLIYSRAPRKFHYKLNWLLGTILAQELDSDEEGIENFKLVEESIQESVNEIGKIIHYGPGFEIYRTRSGGVGFWHENIPTYLKPAVSEFSQLSSISNVILSSKDKKLANQQLASALYSSFNSVETENVLSSFIRVENFINTRAKSNAIFWYVMCNSLLMLIIFLLSSLMYIYSDLNKIFIVGTVCGLSGAFLSSLIRFNELSFDILSPFRNVVLQGYSRLLIGAISGSFIIIASNSNLVLGIYSNNMNAIAVFSLISGFCERFVPNLISTISTNQVGESREENF